MNNSSIPEAKNGIFIQFSLFFLPYPPSSLSLSPHPSSFYTSLPMSLSKVLSFICFYLIEITFALFCTSRISDTLPEELPNLQCLYLTNNLVQELADLDNLAGLKKLEHVSLLGNPVTTRDHYRLYLINKLPQVCF